MSSSEWTNPWTGEKAIELVWFHLVAIEAIWATGQLTTKICNWDRLFFWNILSVFFFLVVGYLVMSWHQVLDISISHFFIPASCSEPAKVRTESVRNILRFQNPKMAPQFISKNGREKYVTFDQFWFGLSGARVLHEHVWSLLTGFEVKKNYSKFCISSRPFPQGVYFAYESGIASWAGENK